MYCKILFVACLLININYFHAKPFDLQVDEDDNKNPEEGGSSFFEGDITEAKFEQAKGVAQLITGTRTTWAFGIVPYKFADGAYNTTQIEKIYEGMRLLENQTSINGKNCVTFVPYTNQANWIRIYNGTGCSSNVGKNTSPGEQSVSLKKPTVGSTSTCLTPGIVAHELLHTLGFWHEQSRPDRDNYVTVFYENITPGLEHNFNKYTTGVDLLGLPYDFDSIMHYGQTSFALNGTKTIVPKVPDVTIGQRLKLSNIDVQEVRKYYNCV